MNAIFFYHKVYWLVGLFIFLLYPCTIFGQNEETDKPDVRGSCGGKFTGKSGVIASPDFPEKVPVDSICTYEIEVDSGLVVAYQSTYINLEKDCYDYLVIFPTRNVSEENGIQYCESNAIPLETTQGNKLTVTFHSDEFNPSEGFAISWYSLNVSDLSPTFNCSFDGAVALCPGWTQVGEGFDNMDFQFRRDSTPSDNTGPSQDSSGSGRYAYIEASGKTEGDAAVLVSPKILLNEYEEYCLSVMYHNNGSKPGSLDLIKIDKDGEGDFIYTAENATDKWISINVTLYRSKDPTQIGIRAVRGGGYESDVAIDDIKMLPYPCEIDDYDYNNSYTEYNYTDYDCSESDFQCSDLPGDCIPDSDVCQGTPDCDNGSDEDPAMCAERAAASVNTDDTTEPDISTKTEPTTIAAKSTRPTTQTAPTSPRKVTEILVEKTTKSILTTTQTTTTARRTPIVPTICQRQYEAYLRIKNGDPNSPIGPSLPDCASDGKYIKKQCDYEYCYCVHPDSGAEVLGSRGYKESFVGDCTEDRTPTTASSTTGSEETTATTKASTTAETTTPIEPDIYYDTTADFEETTYSEETAATTKASTTAETTTPIVTEPDIYYDTTADFEETTYSEETTATTKASTTTETTTTKVPTICQRQYEAYLRIKNGDPNSPIGPSLPDCASDGKYIKKQCDYEYCYCVHPESGVEVLGSRVFKDSFVGDCTEGPTTVMASTATSHLTTPIITVLTACQQQRQNYTTSRNETSSFFPTDSYFPDCTPGGLYAPSQCDEDTGYCFCVDEKTGLIIRGTRRLKNYFSLDCLALTPCQMSFHNISLFREHNPTLPRGPFPPDCTSDGLFARRQCDLLTLVCRCVEPASGAVIDGTETKPFQGLDLVCKDPATQEEPVTTEDSTVPTPPAGDPTCMLIYNAVTNFIQENLEAEIPHVPVCKEDGSYRPLQCNSTSGACWCVDEQSGNFIAGSATAPGQGHLLNCSDPQPQSCGATFTNLTGVIESPNFPNSYTNLAGCFYKIERSDKAQYVVIKMQYLNLAPKDVDGFCLSDRLSFGNSDQLLYAACGTFVDDSSMYFDTDVILQLIPGDKKDPKKGFSLSYEIKTCPLSGQLFSKIASSCDKTCSNMDPVCIKDVAERCVCPPEKPILYNRTCITAEKCPNLKEENQINTTSPTVLYTSPPVSILYPPKIESVTIASSSSEAVCLSIAASLTATIIHALVYLASEQNGEPVAQGNADRKGDEINLCFQDLLSDTEYVALLWSTEHENKESAFPFSFKTMAFDALPLTPTMDSSTAALVSSASAESTKKSTQPIDVTTSSTQPDNITKMSMTAEKLLEITPLVTTVAVSDLESDSSSTSEKMEETSESDEFSVLEVDSTTVCAKIPHQMQSIDSYMVTLDETQMLSSEGESDKFQNVPAASPFTYACFHDLQPNKDYSLSVNAKQGTSFIGERKNKSFKQKRDETDVGTTPQPLVYPQTEETKQWQRSYNDWRTNTLNKWYTTLSSYLKAAGTQFPDLAPDHTKCPPVYRPRCKTQPVSITDYNGCLFFICQSPSTEGDLTQNDVDAWKMEHNIFKDYLMPQWQELFAAYTKAQKQP